MSERDYMVDPARLRTITDEQLEHCTRIAGHIALCGHGDTATRAAERLRQYQAERARRDKEATSVRGC